MCDERSFLTRRITGIIHRPDLHVSRPEKAVTMPATAPSTATVTPVAMTTAAATLFAANTDARGRTIHNGTEHVLYVKLGAGAAQADMSLTVPAGMTYELPPIAPVYASGEVVGGCYSGLVTGALDAGTGTVFATEVE
jgi:hypothetical protein